MRNNTPKQQIGRNKLRLKTNEIETTTTITTKTIQRIKQIKRKREREKTQSNTIRDKKKVQGNSNNHKGIFYDTKI